MQRTSLHIQELEETQFILADGIILSILCTLGAYVGRFAVTIIQNNMPLQSSVVLDIVSAALLLAVILCTAICLINTTIFLICRHKKQHLEKTVRDIANCTQ